MVERRFVPMYLALCAVALAVWTASGPGPAPAPTLGWALAGMAALFTVAILIDRRTGSPRSMAHVLEEATQANAARVANPRLTSSGKVDDPRR